MKGPRPNYSPSDSQREAIRGGNTNKIISPESRMKISKSLSKAVYVYTPDIKLITKYSAVTIAKKELRIGPATIKKYCESGKIYQNKYRFSYVPLVCL